MLNFFGMMDWSNMMNWAGFPSVFGWTLGLGITGILVAVAVAVFWLWMLVDLLQRKTPDKLAWVVVLVFLNVIGAILYYFLVFAKKRR